MNSYSFDLSGSCLPFEFKANYSQWWLNGITCDAKVIGNVVEISGVEVLVFVQPASSRSQYFLIEKDFGVREYFLMSQCQGILLVDGPTNRGPSSPCT
jgi:hypothetical protein